MDKILTVVVPAYNVERYLSETLDSMIGISNLDVLEIIVVDDGSQDGTAQFAQKYAEQYPDTIFIISKKNGGHGSTINVGIQHANGKYFKVIDGDDWVNSEEFDEFIRELLSSDADLVVSRYHEVNTNTKEHKAIHVFQNPCNIIIPFDQAGDDIFYPMHAFTIKTEILKTNGIVIDENCFYVDMELVLLPIPYINTVLFVNQYVYMYRVAQVEQSISAQGWYKHRNDHLTVLTTLLSFYDKIRKDSRIPSFHKHYIYKRIAQSVAARFTIGLKFEFEQAVAYALEIKSFDIWLKDTYPCFYKAIAKRCFVRFFRKLGYSPGIYGISSVIRKRVKFY